VAPEGAERFHCGVVVQFVLHDTIFIERLWRTVKYEIYLKDDVSLIDAHAQLDPFFRFYNDLRPHRFHDGATPSEVYRRKTQRLPVGAVSALLIHAWVISNVGRQWKCDETHMDHHRRKRRSQQLQVVPVALRPAQYASGP